MTIEVSTLSTFLVQVGSEDWGKRTRKAGKSALKAAEDVANNPEDEDAIASFRLQLKKILTAPENAVLVAQIEEILAEGKKTVLRRVKLGRLVKQLPVTSYQLPVTSPAHANRGSQAVTSYLPPISGLPPNKWWGPQTQG